MLIEDEVGVLVLVNKDEKERDHRGIDTDGERGCREEGKDRMRLSRVYKG